MRLPKLPMAMPCNHIRKDERNHYGCAVLGECKPIRAGPDLSVCPQFQPNGRAPRPAPKAAPLRAAAPAKATRLLAKPSCKHLGDDTGKRVECSTCKGKIELEVLACSVHGECTVSKMADLKQGKIACCRVCKEYEAR